MARAKRADHAGEPARARSAARLRAREWRRFLKAPDQEVLEELYVPALSAAIRYDRCCGYFSSTVLAAASRGFAGLIERLRSMGDAAPRPAVRLVVNEELTEEDVRALLERRDTETLERHLRGRFTTTRDLLERERLRMLAWLASRGLLEVRVGIMRQGRGMLHAKFGIMTDSAGDAVVFSGSDNETGAAILAHYERLEVSTSWEDPARPAPPQQLTAAADGPGSPCALPPAAGTRQARQICPLRPPPGPWRR